jgi:thiol-disulfide isomerase/thioredoxin
MATMRIGTRFLAGAVMLAGLGGLAKGQDRVADLVGRKPVQPGVKVTQPSAAEVATLKAEPIKYADQPTVSGVTVKDTAGKTVRQMIVITGAKKQQFITYYLDGVEAYREIDTTGSGKPDTFRWLGPNGGKQGRDLNGDGTIDAWDILSAEEASQELVEAMATNNTARFQALLVTEKDLSALGLPAAEAAKIQARVGKAVGRFADAVKKHGLTPQAKWVQLASNAAPHTTPADAVGGQFDVTRMKLASVLVEKGTAAPNAASVLEMVPTGEMLQVGRAWKLVDGPGDEVGPGVEPTLTGKAKILVDQLVGKSPPPPGSPPAVTLKYHVDRYTLLEQIVAETKGADQEPWVQQLVDALSAAAEMGGPDNEHAKRLEDWTTAIVKADPKGANAAYAKFRQLSAEYTGKLAAVKPDKPDEVGKVQNWWREALDGYLKSYGTSADAPDAMLRLAVAFEFAKDGEAKEIEWCEKLAANFPNHPFAAKAKGIVARLTSEGKPFTLAGPVLGTTKNFDVASLKGKPVLVVYWANWSNRAKEEAKLVNELAKEFGPKGLEIVTVNLDDNAQTAAQALAQFQMPGTPLHQPGGVDGSPLAVQYGVLGPHAFLVNKDGKVVNKAAQLTAVGDEIEKLLK